MVATQRAIKGWWSLPEINGRPFLLDQLFGSDVLAPASDRAERTPHALDRRAGALPATFGRCRTKPTIKTRRGPRRGGARR